MPTFTPDLLSKVRPGDTVTIRSRFGTEMQGRCTMKRPTHAVLNLGGRHGLPAIAENSNIVSVKKGRSRN